eukprot:CCRYP_007668-RB/>CCRYP_007668-RB protein AED:0.43 eAED:0.51 QI:0/0.66/0.5/1/0/0/4/343/100
MCHIESLRGSFGGSLNIMKVLDRKLYPPSCNGGLECPAHPNNYHADAIVTRLPFPWFTATVTGVKGLLSFDRCDGLAQKFEDCNLSGICALAEVDSDMPT